MARPWTSRCTPSAACASCHRHGSHDPHRVAGSHWAAREGAAGPVTNSPDPNGTTVYAYINGEFAGDGNWYNGPTDTRKGDTVCAEDGTGDGSYSSSLPTAAGVPGLDA